MARNLVSSHRFIVLIFALSFVGLSTTANAQSDLGDELNALLVSTQMETDELERAMDLASKDEN